MAGITKKHFPKGIFQGKLIFALWFVVFFLFFFAAFYISGLVPEEITFEPLGSDENIPSLADLEYLERQKGGEFPVRIVAEGVDFNVRNPESADIDILDEELKRGVVRYPASGLLGKGNLFLFGHSSRLPVVNNPAFKAFSNLYKLEEGDEITVFSDSKKYVYRVRTVKLVNADEALVDFSADKNMITLSTCNSFGERQERYVVEADFIRSYALD